MPNVIDLRRKLSPAPVPEKPFPVPSPKEPEPVNEPEPAPLPEPAALPVPSELDAQLAARQSVRWDAHFHHGIHWRQLVVLGGIAILAGIGIWLVNKDVVALVFLGLTMLILVMHHKKEPERTPIEVTDYGVKVKDKTYYHKDLKSFWIEYNPDGIKELSLQLRHWYAPYVKVPLHDQDPAELHTVLSAVLPEEQHQLSLVDVFLRHPPKR